MWSPTAKFPATEFADVQVDNNRRLPGRVNGRHCEKKMVDPRRTFQDRNLGKYDSKMKGDIIKQCKEYTYVSWEKCTPTSNSKS